MNEHDIAKKISQYLNHGTNQLDRDVLARLQTARAQALEAHAKPSHALNLAWAGTTSTHHDGGHHPLSFWLAITALLAGLLLVTNWQAMDDDTTDSIDATLLAEELPFNAYLDSDFDTWLEE